MARITFLGGEETGNVDHVDWGRFRFDLRVPVECDDPHIVAKASKNQFFKVSDLPNPLDHDGDGKSGGSVKPAPTEDLADLREDYTEIVGKKPFPGWNAETLREKIAAAEKAKPGEDVE